MGGRGSSFRVAVGPAAIPAADFAAVSNSDMEEMQREMGQDGTEGVGFVATSRSWGINEFLRTGSVAAAHNVTGWNLTRDEMMQTINRMDREMQPLSRSIKAVRFVDEGFLKSFGLSSRIGARTPSAINAALAMSGGRVRMKGFTSVSANINQNVFTNRPIKLNFRIRAGTPAIATSNRLESEFVLGRNQEWVLSNPRIRSGGGLEIDVLV